MGDWTNAVKAAVIALVNSFMVLILAVTIFAGLDVNVEAYAGLQLAVTGFVNTLLALWVLFTYRNSPARATHEQLQKRGLKP